MKNLSYILKLSRCKTARTFPRFRCASSKTQPRCAGPGFCFPSAPSSLTVRFSALLICHAAPVRNARLPSASACSPARYTGLRPASLRSTRAAHDGCALLICHAAKRPGRSLAFAAPQAKPSPAARAPAFAFPPLQAPSLSVSPRFSFVTLRLFATRGFPPPRPVLRPATRACARPPCGPPALLTTAARFSFVTLRASSLELL